MARKKNITDFRALATEDYLKYPERVLKPGTYFLRNASADDKKTKKDAYKAYEKAVEETAMANLDIMIGKLLVELDKRTESFNFMCTEENSKVPYLANGKVRDMFSETEECVKAAFFGIVAKKLNYSLATKTRDSKMSIIGGGWDYTSVNLNYLHYLPQIAQIYNVAPHWFSEYKDENPLRALTYDDLTTEWYNSHRGTMRDSTREKLSNEADKMGIKALKAREKFAKTDRFAAIVELLTRIEKDLKATEPTYLTFDEEVTRIEAYNAKQAKLLSLENELTPVVENVLKNEYSDKNICGKYELIKKAAEAMYETGEVPQILVREKRTGSWLAGMKHYVTIEVMSADDTKSFGKVNLEDEGLGNADGFGPWD